jgi:hypothetical protein
MFEMFEGALRRSEEELTSAWPEAVQPVICTFIITTVTPE